MRFHPSIPSVLSSTLRNHESRTLGRESPHLERLPLGTSLLRTRPPAEITIPLCCSLKGRADFNGSPRDVAQVPTTDCQSIQICWPWITVPQFLILSDTRPRCLHRILGWARQMKAATFRLVQATRTTP